MFRYYSIAMNYDKPCHEYEAKGMYNAFTSARCFLEYLESFFHVIDHNKELSKNDKLQTCWYYYYR